MKLKLMMRVPLYLVAAVCCFITACKTTPPPVPAPAPDGTVILWVANHKAACPGPALMECLLVKGENETAWRYFSDPIQGFSHVDGFEYKIKVFEQKVAHPQPGGPKSLYRLVEVLEKKQTPPDMRLHDIWAFESAKDNAALNKLPREKKPVLEIMLAENRYGGNAPCNQYSGQIESYGTYIRFSSPVSTLMACEYAAAESEYFKIIRAARFFRLENLRLVLLDKDGKEIARFRKVD